MRGLLLLAMGLALGSTVGGFVTQRPTPALRGPGAQRRGVQVGPRWMAVLDKVPLPKAPKPNDESWGELGASLKRFAGAAPGGIMKQMEEQVLPMAKAVLFKEKGGAAPAAEQEVAAPPEPVEEEKGGGEPRKKREFFADMRDLAVRPAPPAVEEEAPAPVVEPVGEGVGATEGLVADEGVPQAADATLQEIENLLSASIADEIVPKELSQEWMDSDNERDDEDDWDRPSPSWMIDSPNKH
mmetsp:Transcript_22231/g.54784  ORF Transcript_22231/g.54784 Transcript_22231/m.54784 type:complete len:241 (-) Transcript_22231:374-1096(-)